MGGELVSKNEVYRVGQYVPAPLPAGTAAGTAKRLGVLNLVTVGEVATAEHEPYGHEGSAPVDLGGAWILPVTISGGATSFGQAVYITDAGALVTTATGNNLFGAILEYGVPNGTNTPLTVKILN